MIRYISTASLVIAFGPVPTCNPQTIFLSHGNIFVLLQDDIYLQSV